MEFRFKAGKKINIHGLGKKSFISLPCILHASVEIRSYEDFANPHAKLGIAVYVVVLRSLDHTQKSTWIWYYDNGVFVDERGTEIITRHYTNINDVKSYVESLVKSKI